MKLLLLSLAAALTCTGSALAQDAAPATPAAAAPASLTVSDFTFTPPAPWVAKAEPRQMSAGGYTLAGKDDVPGVEMDFYHFGPGAGGGVDANVGRWKNQFKAAEGQEIAPVRADLTMGKFKVTLVTIKGTFLSGPMFAAEKTPLTGHMMIGAILQSENGDVFIKIVGPEAAVSAAEPEVKKLLSAACGEKEKAE